MKKRYTTLLVLCILLAVLAGAVVLLRASQAEESSSYQEVETILGIDADQITSLEWTVNDTDFVLQRTETDDSSSSSSSSGTSDSSGWSYPANSALPLDESIGDDLADTMADLTAARTLDAPENAADYGLDAPRLVVTVGTDDGSYTLLVGGVNDTTGDVYVQMLETQTVYTLESDIVDSFPTTENDLILVESMPAISMSSVTDARLETPQGLLELHYTEPPEDDSSDASSDASSNSASDSASASDSSAETSNWTAFLDGEALSVTDEQAEAVVRDILALSYDSCADYAPASLADYGLDEPLYTLTLTYTETDSSTASSDSSDSSSDEAQTVEKTFTLYLGSQDASGSVYAFQEGGVQVGLVGSSVYDTLLSALADVTAAG